MPTRKLLIIDEPPTETKGSGMPVIGTTPSVIPTLTKTWKRKPKTIPAATKEPKRSPAPATMRRPRQTTSMYSSNSTAAPTKPRCSASEANAKSVLDSGR